ncbi:MAG: hypothetical protein KF754_04555 [Planctomycetes bacterium]|nr:hypothetical protein [Planctomycetota bacterium]
MLRSRLILVLLGLAVLSPMIVAQQADEAGKPDPKVALMKLYRTQGATWSHRMVSWSRGGLAVSSTETSKVEKATDAAATLSVAGRSKDGNHTWSSNAIVYFNKPAPEFLAYAGEKLVEETLDMGFAKFPCKKHRLTLEGQQLTTWVSTEHHPLIVKQVSLSADATEIRKLTSFQSTETDPWLLYRMVGRSWTLKTTATMPGQDPIVSGTRQTVTALEANATTITLEVLDSELKPMAGAEPMETRIELVSQAKKPAAMIEEGESAVETLRTGAGEFECRKSKLGASTVWMSTVWPTLLVKSQSANLVSELASFDLGHDASRLYRKAGNSFTQRITTTMGAMTFTSYTRQHVLKVEDETVTVAHISLDQNGREIGRNEVTMPLPASGDPLLGYDGQREELVSTPAGSFPGLVQDVGNGMKMWTYHGLMVRLEQKTDEIVMVMEVSELKLE